MPLSMTAFARKQHVDKRWTLICEIRSINHRFLDCAIKLPEPLREVEMPIRGVLREQLQRGRVECRIDIKVPDEALAEISLNGPLFRQLLSIARELNLEFHSPSDLNAMDFLNWPGMLVQAEEDRETLQAASEQLVSDTVKELVKARQNEGKTLAQFIEQRLDEMRSHIKPLQTSIEDLLARHRAKLQEKISSFKVEVDPERLEQEVVLAIQKNDVNEELDRLSLHINEVSNVLKQSGGVGRRLDFLMQELNREANTLSAKAFDIKVTKTAIELKVLIEQMREQIQNLE